MEGTKPKSIFDIPKPIVEEPPPPPPPKKRVVRRKKKKIKVARAGGVEVSQKRNVKGQRQITLKHKGGLTQEITIYTGDQKPRGVKAKGQTASWNMKPAKFKASRGLRDDRVYLQPPKREYFGNRYKSALDEIKINQKVKEAGASKNKEIAAVRETANIQKRELERREAARLQTISELEKQRAGLVASHNVSVRNQSQATLLGGDVGELNKLIQRRGVGAIRQLINKGEISDASTVYQLNLTPAQIDGLIRALDTQKQTLISGSRLVYITPDGLSKSGILTKETDRFVFLRLDDGRNARVPKSLIRSGEEVAKARTQSRSASVQRGEEVPPASDFDEPNIRRTKSDIREAPDWRKSARRNDLGRPRRTGDEPPRARTEPRFSEEPDFEDLLADKLAEGLIRSATAPVRVTSAEFREARSSLKSTVEEKEEADAAVASVRREGFLEGAEEALESVEEFSGREEAAELSETTVDFEPSPEPEPVVEATKRGRKRLGQRLAKSIPTTIPELEGVVVDESNIAELSGQIKESRGAVESELAEIDRQLGPSLVSKNPAVRAAAEKVRRQSRERSLERASRGRSESVSESESGSGSGSGSESEEGRKFREGEVVFLNAAQVRDKAREDKRTIILVDNRPESKLSDGGRPAIKVSVKDLQSTIDGIYGADSKKAKGAREKIVKKEYKDFYTNDDGLLDNYFG
jgi:hypothetical protein